MFHRGDAHPVLYQGGRKPGIPDVFRLGRDIDRLGQIDTPEHDTGIRSGRTQGEIHLLAGVQTNTGRPYDILQRALPNHAF